MNFHALLLRPDGALGTVRLDEEGGTPPQFDFDPTDIMQMMFAHGAPQGAYNGRTTLVLDTFDVPVDLIDRNVCGGVNGQFEVSLEITAYEMDGAGFVTHNEGVIALIKNRFDPRRGPLKASCEELAAGVVNAVLTEIGSRAVEVKAVVENLTGRVEVLWNTDMRLQPPPFPRPATIDELRAEGRHQDADRMGWGGFDFRETVDLENFDRQRERESGTRYRRHC